MGLRGLGILLQLPELPRQPLPVTAGPVADVVEGLPKEGFSFRRRSRTPSPRRSRTPSDDERIIHRSPLDESRFVVGPLPSPFVLDQ